MLPFCRIVMLAAFLITPAIVSAQGAEEIRNSTPEERAEMQTEWMKKTLSLDSGAAAAVHQINLKYAKKNQAAMESGGSRRNKLRSLKKLSSEKDAELEKVLSAEQYRTYTKKKDEMKDRMKEEVRERRGSRR